MWVSLLVATLVVHPLFIVSAVCVCAHVHTCLQASLSVCGCVCASACMCIYLCTVCVDACMCMNETGLVNAGVRACVVETCSVE